MQDLIEQPANVMSIIQTAVSNGADPDQLDKLLTLQERWEKTEARKAYNRAMKLCQEEMPVVVKNAENKDNHARYSTLDNLLAAVKQTITKHGFSLSFGSTDAAIPQHVLVTCDCMHEAGHTERYSLNCPYDTTGPKGGATKTAIQGMGSAVSYGRRYLVYMIFNVAVSNEDDDGAAGKMAQKIGEQEVRELSHWLDQLQDFEKANFFDYMGVGSLPELPVKGFAEALRALKAKVADNKKKGR